MAQRCSYCGRTRKQHKGKPCIDVAGFRRVLDAIKDSETVCMHGARPFDCRMCMIRERGKDES